jgi:beta-glucosidase
LVLNNGRPIAIPWAAENIPNLEGWQLGNKVVTIAQVLYGDYNPSGKLLSMSFQVQANCLAFTT